MAAEWLRQYSNSDISRTSSFRRRNPVASAPFDASRQASNDIFQDAITAGSYNASERSYPESVDPEDDGNSDIGGLTIASRKTAQPLTIPGRHDDDPASQATAYSNSSAGGINDTSETSRRRTSISFDPKVRLDDGLEADLESALPKLNITTRPHGKSLLDEMEKSMTHGRARSENDSQEYDPETGERLDEREERERNRRRSAKFKAHQSRWPLLQSTVDELAGEKQEPDERESSLTSQATLSPDADEVQTPVDDVVISPVNLSASVGAEWTATPKLISKALPHRSSSYAIERSDSHKSKWARATRRSTTNSSSQSPASAFLSRYIPSSPVAQPDDEGQEVGDYVLGREIGFGGFSVIREAFTFSGNDKIVRAVKIVRKNISGRDEQENDNLQAEFDHEVEIWRSLSHEYILPLFAIYSTNFATFAITHLNTGGTLFDAVRSNRSGLPPHLIKRYAFQLASALRYLHEDMHIIHRDIKLENCLIDKSTSDAIQTGGKLLLCDFGLADYIPSSDNTTPSPSSHTEYQSTHPSGTGIDPRTPSSATWMIGPADTSTNFAGSLPYAAPELLESSQGVLSTSVDIWAYGVVVFALTMGKLPFTHAFSPRLRMMILGEEWDKDGLRAKEDAASDLSFQEASSFSDAPEAFNPNPLGGSSEMVERCMDLDPMTRWDIQDILCCQWLQDEVEFDAEEP